LCERLFSRDLDATEIDGYIVAGKPLPQKNIFHATSEWAIRHRRLFFEAINVGNLREAVHPTTRFTITGMHGNSTVSRVVIYILQAWQNFLGLPRPAHRIFMRWVTPHFGHTHSMVMPSPH